MLSPSHPPPPPPHEVPISEDWAISGLAWLKSVDSRVTSDKTQGPLHCC